MRKLRPEQGVRFVEGHTGSLSEPVLEPGGASFLPTQLPPPPAWLLDFFFCVLVSESGTDLSGLSAFHPPALSVYVPVNGPLQAGPAAEREPASHLELRLPQNVYGARSRNETTSILLTGPKHCTHSWPDC